MVVARLRLPLRASLRGLCGEGGPVGGAALGRRRSGPGLGRGGAPALDDLYKREVKGVGSLLWVSLVDSVAEARRSNRLTDKGLGYR
jgi:hypothetical protein